MTTEYTDHFRLNLPDFRMGPWHDLVNEDFIMIDGLLFSLYQGVDTQTWQNNTVYDPGTTAIDPADNTFWVCIVHHTSAPTGTFAADRAAHPGYWNRVVVGIAPRGEWQNNTHYLPNDMVSDSVEHVIAVCKTEHTSNASGTIRDDAAYWTFIADIGSAEAIAANVVYDNSTSGAAGTNLQATTDDLYAKNGSQQTAIDANTAAVANYGPRITAVENKNATQDTQIASNTSGVTTNTNNITTLSGRVTNVESVNTTQDGRLTALESAGSGYIADAPADGTTYARKNHAWIDVLSVAGASVLVADAPPGGARDSSLWWESDSGRLFIKYNDGDSSQWVDAVPQLDAGSFLAKSGDTMTGLLTLSGDPASALQAATKQYVDNTERSPLRVVSGSDTIVASDFGKTLIVTANANITLGAVACATLGNGWWCRLVNAGTVGITTIDPNASEQIDGANTASVYPSESMVLWTAGGAFTTLDHAGEWLPYTPTWSGSTGGTPTMGAVSAIFKKIRTSVYFSIDATITAVSTATGFLQASTPTSMANSIPLSVTETSANGFGFHGLASGGSMYWRKYDNTSSLIANARYLVSGLYQTAK